MLNLSKLIAWKFFQHRVRWILCLFCVVLVVSSAVYSFLNQTAAYPFVEADEYNVLDDPRYAVEGDFDGDGELDLAVVNFRSSFISIVINNGDGTFEDSVNYPSGGIGPIGITAGYFNADGALDLAVVNYITLGTTLANVQIFINDGSGAFTPGATYTGFNRPSSLVADFFNADANIDLAVTNSETNNITVLLGNGTGGFSTAVGSPFSCPKIPTSVISGDFNNDSKNDLVVVNIGKSRFDPGFISIHLGNGDGTFNPYTTISSISASAQFKNIVSGDFDADSDLDLAVAMIQLDTSAPVEDFIKILENTGVGSGIFTYKPEVYFRGQRTSGLTVADLNNDAILDLAVIDLLDSEISILTGNNNLTFNQAVPDVAVGDGPAFILAADFDNDLKNDLVTLNIGVNNQSYAFPNDPGGNSFSYLRNFGGVKILQTDRYKFVSEQGMVDSYQVVLSSAPPEDVTINIINDAQISLDTNVLVFTAADWNIAQNVNITAINDLVAEGSHYSFINHSASTLSGTTDFDGLIIPDVKVLIADNDQPGVVIYETNGFTEVVETGASDTYRIVLESEPDANVNITINSGTEITAWPNILNFTSANWFTPQIVTLTAISDNYIEGLLIQNIIHTVTSSDPSPEYNTIYNLNVSIIDSNNLPHNPLCIGLTGDLVYNFQVNGLDYNQMNKMLLSTAPPSFCADVVMEGGIISPIDLNNFRIYLQNNYYVEPEVVIAEDSGVTNVTEGGATDTYIVYLRRKPIVDVYIDIDTNSQLTTNKTQLVFSPLDFSVPQDVIVTAVNDSYIEASPHPGVITHTAFSADSHYSPAMFRVINTLDPTGDLFLGINTVTANITDNDTAGIIVTGSPAVDEATVSSDTVGIKLTSDPGAGITIILTIDNIDGQITVAPPTLTYTSANWSSDQLVTITAFDDTLNELSPHIGRVRVRILSDSDPNINPVVWRGTSYIDVNITDNDAPPTISIDDVAALEGDAGTTLFNFTVSLSAASGMQVTVLYDIADGTATVGNNDYVDFFQDLLVFNPGEDTKTISVTVNGDINPEPNETFYINLSGAVNATIIDAQGVGTILDDDTGGITVSAISGNTTESGGTATFTVVLDRLPTADVTIGISSSDLTEGTVLPASLTFTPANWDTLQTVTVTGVDDSVIDGNISYIILTAAAVSADPAYIGLNPPDVAVINLDNDLLGGGQSFYTPANLTCTAIDLTVNNTLIKAINWDFTDNNTAVLGFRLYGVGLIRDVATPDITQIQEPDVTQDPIEGLLGVNQAYTRTVRAYNNSIESADSNPATCYTLANQPLQPQVVTVGADNITVRINPNDGNPPETLYAIMVATATETNFVNPDGSFSSTEAWHTYAEFGGDSGIVVIGTPAQGGVTGATVQMALNMDEEYCFSAQAQNGDGIETVPSISTCDETPPLSGIEPNITALKGVAINLAWNSSFGLFSTAWAGDKFIINANEPLSRVLGVFAWLLNISLIILLIIFALSLQQSLKHLKHEFKYPETFKLIRLILSGEANDSYQNHAQQTEDGIFNKSSYHWHKTLHNLSQGTFIGAMALVGLKLMILGALVAGLINLNHTSLAQNEPYNQSNTPVEVGDTLTYIIEVKNNITATAQDAPISNAAVTDILDGNLENLIVTGLSNCGDYADNSTATTLNISGIDVAIGTTCFITFTADVKIGSEGNTIANQAQVSGSNFNLLTNETSNLVMAAAPTNGNVNQPPINGNINQPPTNTNQPPTNTNQPPTNTNQPPTNTNQPPTNINQSPINTNQPPTNTNQPPINTNQPPTNTNQPPIGPGTTESQIPIIGPIIDSTNDTLRILAQIEPFKSLNEIILDNPQVEQASQNVVTPILLGVSVFSLLPAVLFSTLYLLPFLHLIFLEPFLLLFGKKRKKWGVVYNSLTKLPIDLALVRLYNQANNQLIQTKVTDRDGRYIMIAKEPGKYYLSVTRPGFISPSKYLQGEQQDLKYLDLYHGEVVEVAEKGAVITANIPLDPAEKTALPIADVIRSYFVKNLRLIVSYIGIILALVVVIIVPTIITIGALLLHILLFMAFRRLIVPAKPKNWGIVYDQNNKKPLKNSVVRIFDIKFNKLLETQVTDSHGRYAFLVGQNEYQMLMEKPGYQNKEVKPVDLVNNEEIVNLDVGLNKI